MFNLQFLLTSKSRGKQVKKMNISEIRESGLLDRYIVQDLSDDELVAFSGYLKSFPELKEEITAIEKALEAYAFATAVQPPQTVKPMLMSALDYMERLEGGEPQNDVPRLDANSKKEDFDVWLKRADLQEATEYESMFAHIIGKSNESSTAIVWLKHGAPPEIHSHEIEKFLILEGTCEITIDDKVHTLMPSDFLAIPLHVSHHVRVTSTERCKLILERTAA